MRILIIHSGYPLNETTGEVVRTMNMAYSLNGIGHKVTVLMLYNILHFKLHNLKFTRRENNIRQIQVPTFPTSRLLNISLFYNRLVVWIVAKIIRSQVIQAEVTWSASTTKFISSIPLITDFHSDLVPELEATNRSLKFIKKSKIDNVYALTHSYRILCVSDTLHKNLSETYGIQHERNILPCNVDFKVFTRDKLTKRTELRECYGLVDKIVLAYLGGTHQWQCLNETLDIFSRLRKIDSRYYFCLFTNSNTDQFTEKIIPLKESIMIQSLSRDNIAEHLSMIDAGFVIRDNMLLNINSSPTKTSEYMACGAMVVATQFSGDAPTLIKESGFGFILDSITPCDLEISKLHRGIIDYHNNYSDYADSVRQYIEYNRDWKRNEEKLENIYNSLVQR